ncbi:MAG: MCE family protein [Acidimicrobiales bacterium]
MRGPGPRPGRAPRIAVSAGRRLRHLPPTVWKFAVFTVACLVLLVVLAVHVGNLSLFSSRHTIKAQLTDVTGLAVGDPVDVAGVRVGQVSSIAVQRAHAMVDLSVDNTLRLRRGTFVGLRWRNVIGQKDVYLYPAKRGPVLAPTATVPISHDVSDASVNAFLNSLGPLLASINTTQANAFVENVSGALQGDTAKIDQLIDSGAAISKTVGSLDTQVGQVIGSLDQVLTAIASRSGDLGSLVSNLKTVAQSLSSRNGLLDAVVGNLSQVAGDLANLIGTNRSTLDGTISDLDTVTADIVAHQNDLARSLSTLGSGLAPYVEISSYGQWFQVETVYTCLANQTSCTYYEPTSPPSGSGVGGGPPSGGPVPAAPSGAPTGAASPKAGGNGAGTGTGGGEGTSDIPSILGKVAGPVPSLPGAGTGVAGSGGGR